MRNGILGSMATMALGAGLAYGQAVPTLQQGLRLPGATPGSAPAFPMSFPQTSGPVFPEPTVPPVQAGPIYPGQPMQPMQSGSMVPAQIQNGPMIPAQIGPNDFATPGHPLTVGPDTAADEDDRSRDSDDKNYGPGPVPYRLWGRVEALFWWVKPGPGDVPLTTTGAPATAGILNQPGVSILIGGREFDFGNHPGVRLTTGFWFDKEGCVGAELTGFIMGDKTINSALASDANGTLVIGRPVINALTGQEASLLLSTPGQLAGGIRVDSTNELYGAEVNFVGSVFRSKCLTADMLVGFRYMGLDERLNINSNSTVLSGGVAAFNGSLIGPGSTLSILDHFETRNDFYGGQIGGRTQVRWNRFFADFEGKLAVGNSHEVVNINGVTTLTGTSGAAFQPAGLLAVSSNSGMSSRDEFTFIPEAGAKVGFHLTNHVSLFVGYTFIYWFDVARPGDQIDRVVNPALVPSNLAFGSMVGPNRPAVSFTRTDFWAQGVNIGLEVRY